MHDSQIRIIAASPYLLPDAITISNIADRSRTAYLALMKSAVTPFKNADLAEWFKGPYRRATMPAGALFGRTPTQFAVARGSIDVHVDVLTLQAREESLEALRHLRNVKDQDTSFTFQALQRGFIRECRDADGTRGLVPVDLPQMKLYERALSLIAVDYVANPQDFEERLALCRRCEMPFFDGIHACARGLSIHLRRAG